MGEQNIPKAHNLVDDIVDRVRDRQPVVVVIVDDGVTQTYKHPQFTLLRGGVMSRNGARSTTVLNGTDRSILYRSRSCCSMSLNAAIKRAPFDCSDTADQLSFRVPAAVVRPSTIRTVSTETVVTLLMRSTM